MAANEDDDRPKKKISHEVGQDLSLLSIEEIRDRILMLRNEIARLETAMASKQVSRISADQFFKK